MNFLNLYYFSVTAEELSFTKASQKLFISQQSLSNHISKLEAKFNVVLFNRTHPMSLTDAGLCLYKRSQTLLDQKRQMEQALQDIRDFRSGSLTIGVTTSRGAVMLAQILPVFRHRFPQVRLHLAEGTTQQINDALYGGKTDVNIGFAFNDPEHVREYLLHKEHLVCVIPNKFLNLYLTNQGEQPRAGSFQDFKLFAACPFLKMPHDTLLGEVFEHCCRDYGVNPEVVLETTSMATLGSLCAAGLGAIILPESFVRQGSLFWSFPDTGSVVTVYPLDYSKGIKSITISVFKSRYQTRAAKEFIKLARELFAVDHEC